MIVVAIIGILAAIAIPQYQDYVTRSRWSDNFQSIASLKAAIAECLQNNNGDLTVCDSDVKLANGGFVAVPFNLPTPKYATVPVTLAAGTGLITILGNSAAGNCTVTLRPNIPVGGATVQWNFDNPVPATCNRTKTGVGT
jgi:type IV pilus assembly protein PilA